MIDAVWKLFQILLCTQPKICSSPPSPSNALVTSPMGIAQLQSLVPTCLIPNQLGLGAILFSYLNCFSCGHSKGAGSLCGRQGVDLTTSTFSTCSPGSCHLWLILFPPGPAACPAGSQVMHHLQVLVYHVLLLPCLIPLWLHQ